MGCTSLARGVGGGSGGVARYLPGFHKESRHHHHCFVSSGSQQYYSSETTSPDVELEFLDHCDMHLGESSSSDEFNPNEEMELREDREYDQERVNEDNTIFWDNQLQLLQTNLYRTSSLESKIRNVTKEAVKDTEIECSCSSRQQMGASSCRNCLMREVCRRLQNSGFNSAICNTKWATSPNIPSGEHTFMDVLDTSTSKDKGTVTRVIIELNFRAEFEMARASEEYNRLVRRLPEVYVGKVERLSNILKILCMAAKRCMKENKMHMGPWRKHKYMQTKWLGPCKRNTSTTSLSVGHSHSGSGGIPRPKPKASMLTVDLLEINLPSMHCTAVQVV